MTRVNASKFASIPTSFLQGISRVQIRIGRGIPTRGVSCRISTKASSLPSIASASRLRFRACPSEVRSRARELRPLWEVLPRPSWRSQCTASAPRYLQALAETFGWGPIHTSCRRRGNPEHDSWCQCEDRAVRDGPGNQGVESERERPQQRKDTSQREASKG